MPNKLVIDRSPYYTRCAVLLDGDLHEIHIMPAGGQSIEGNIFVGRVETISKGIDAAFVNIGLKENAFLYIDERADKDFIKGGQAVVVQALKDASKGKGVYITTNISFAGTYVVLFPDGNNAHVGVSVKISDKEERKRLIDLIRPHVPENSSVVLRTSAEGANEEIIEDLKLLIQKMESTLRYAENIKPPALIYEEKHFLEKIIRDTHCYNLEEIVVNDEGEYSKLKPLADRLMINIKTHDDPLMIFDYFSVEGKIKELLNKKVWLKSGAFLIIDETEALVAIDVNTGKSKKRESTGETLFYSNLEAAKEIPRQLRLRNLSGIIVVDFIDMRSNEKRDMVINVLREECAKDRNKTVVLGFTELGLALITRKKTREPISRTLLSVCDCIGGRRYSEKFISYNIYMKIKRMMKNTNKRNVSVWADKNICKHLSYGVDEINNEFGANVALFEKKFFKYGEYELEARG